MKYFYELYPNALELSFSDTSALPENRQQIADDLGEAIIFYIP